MAQNSGRTITARIDRWLDQVFFGAWEVCTLAIPVLWLLLFAPHAEEVSLAAMSALAAASAAVGTYRGGYVDTGHWPRPGHLRTLPIRAAYYGLVVAGATYAGMWAQLLTGSFWPGLVVPWAVASLLLAPLPRVLGGFRTYSRREWPL